MKPGLNKVSKSSLHFRKSGCGIDGKLFEQQWKLDFVFKLGVEAAIFHSHEKRKRIKLTLMWICVISIEFWNQT